MQRVVVGLLVLCFAQACGAPLNVPSPDAGEDPDAGPTFNADTFCREFAANTAALHRRCGALTDAGVDAQLANALLACAQFPGSRRDFVETAARTCLDTIANANCDTLIADELCAAATPGLVALGGGCQATSDCAGGAYCDRTATCPGVCSARIAIGSPVRAGQECVREAYEESSTCVARIAVGASCNGSDSSSAPQCVRGAFCNDDMLCQREDVAGALGADCGPGLPACAVGLACGSECVKAGDVGASCDRWEAPCKADLNCVAGVCAVRGTTGVACDGFDARCAEGFHCRNEPGSFDGECQPRGALGAACSWRDLFGCADGLYCADDGEGGTCVTKKAFGAECSFESECPMYGTCVNQVCVKLGAGGAACQSGNHCLSGNCVDDKCTVGDVCPY